MILVRSPLRISFFGGGSDIPEFYETSGQGMCLSMAINRYIHLAINTPLYDIFKIVYSVIEQVNNVDEIKHDIVRETLKYLHIDNRFEMSTFADIPVKGTGLGSSSSFAVGLIRGCINRDVTKHELAEMASMIEIEKCNEPIGKQDQYAAAFGGLNHFVFSKSGVDCIPVRATSKTIEKLCDSSLLFFTGHHRDAKSILSKQFASPTSKALTQSLVEMSVQAKHMLIEGKLDLFAELMDSAWETKKQINPLSSTPTIDEAYEIAKKLGARGGKILGAGGGGYLYLIVTNEDRRRAILDAFERNFGYINYQFGIDTEGAKVVYNG